MPWPDNNSFIHYKLILSEIHWNGIIQYLAVETLFRSRSETLLIFAKALWEKNTVSLTALSSTHCNPRWLFSHFKQGPNYKASSASFSS